MIFPIQDKKNNQESVSYVDQEIPPFRCYAFTLALGNSWSASVTYDKLYWFVYLNSAKMHVIMIDIAMAHAYEPSIPRERISVRSVRQECTQVTVRQ